MHGVSDRASGARLCRHGFLRVRYGAVYARGETNCKGNKQLWSTDKRRWADEDEDNVDDVEDDEAQTNVSTS